MSALLGRRRVLVAIIFVLVAVVATESVVLAATVVRQGSVEYMKVASTTNYAVTQSTAWTDVPGTALAMPVPAGEHDFFQISFSANNPSCIRNNSAYNGVCAIRAVVDGQPVTPDSVAFGNSANPQSSLPATMQFVSNVLAPGTHYVKMQYLVSWDGMQLSFSARTMTVIRARAY